MSEEKEFWKGYKDDWVETLQEQINELEKKIGLIINEKVWWREERESTLDRIEKLEKQWTRQQEQLDKLEKKISIAEAYELHRRIKILEVAKK